MEASWWASASKSSVFYVAQLITIIDMYTAFKPIYLQQANLIWLNPVGYFEFE